MKIKIFPFLFLLFSFTIANAQNRVVSGKVTSDEGAPLTDATVSLKDSKTATTTDASGNYSISIPSTGKEVLIFSYVGNVNKEVIVGSRNVINVSLSKSSSTLNDVVVVGYGTVKRKDLTGAISTITARDLKDIPINSAEEALAGKLAGVQVTGSEGAPGADVNIIIRGGASITQSNAPLYVVDGIIVDNALSTISPQDIQSIDVLKDASSTAIYGARGANGVVIITTKLGRIGRTVVTYNGLYGVQQVSKELSVMDPYNYVFYQYERAQGSTANEATFASTYGTFADIAQYKNAPAVDWQNQVFGRAAPMQTHNVSVSGGDAKTQFDLSLTDNATQAVMVNSYLDRQLVNFRMNHQVSDKFKIGFNVRFNNQLVNGQGTSNPGTSGFNFLRQVVRYTPYLTEGQSLDYYDAAEVSATNNNGLYLVNPLLLIGNQYQKQYQTVFNFSGYGDYTFTKFLDFRSTFGYDNNNQKINNYDDSLTTNSMLNGNGMPIATISNAQVITIDNSNVFTFSNNRLGGDFNKNNNINVIVGQAIHQINNLSGQTIQRYFPNGTTASEALNNLNLASAPSGFAEPSPTSYQDVQRIASFFGRINYAYKDKYLASASLRADGSTLFSPGKQWGYFPAGALAWRASEENFMQSVKPVISHLKFRVDYGEAGNNRISPYLYLTQFRTTNNYYGLSNQLQTAFGSVSLANANLTWESIVTKDLGMDLGLFNDRVNLTLDYYRDVTRNLLVAVPVSTTSGYLTQIQNVGSTSNNGFEAQLGATIINTKNFRWTSSFNISFNQNKILSLGNNQTSYFQSSGWTTNNPSDFIVKVGQPVGTMYGLVNDGYYQISDFNYNSTTQTYTLKSGVVNDVNITGAAPQPGSIKFKGLNGDTLLSLNNDQTVIGHANPKFFGGFNQQFVYKNFDMSIFLNFVVGNDIFNNNKLEFTGGYTVGANLLSTMNNAWKSVNAQGQVVTDPTALAALNKNTTMWTPVTNAAAFYPQSYAVESGSFLRINNITLGYTFLKNELRALKISKIRAYVTVNNLAVITGYSGYDPEVSTRNSTGLTNGVDYSAYPRARSFIAGLNVTF